MQSDVVYENDGLVTDEIMEYFNMFLKAYKTRLDNARQSEEDH